MSWVVIKPGYSPALRFGRLRHLLFGCSRREVYRRAIPVVNGGPRLSPYWHCCLCHLPVAPA